MNRENWMEKSKSKRNDLEIAKVPKDYMETQKL